MESAPLVLLHLLAADLTDEALLDERRAIRVQQVDGHPLVWSRETTLPALPVSGTGRPLRGVGRCPRAYSGRNVATLVEPPRAPRAEVAHMTPTQARTFLDAVHGDRLEALYTVAVALGLRQGEILGLRWTDVDLDASTITVSQALQRVSGQLAFVEPKSRRSRRTIPMPPTVARSLRAHRRLQLEERLTGGPEWNEHDLVFMSTSGTPLDGRNLTRRFQAALRRAGLPRMRFHDMRHTCASLLLAQGVQPRVVMETLGHSQIGLTLDT